MPEQTPINTTPQKPIIHSIKSFFKKVLLFFLLTLILAFAGYYLYITHPIANDATVEGTLIQFTVGDGYIFKTNEGTINKGTTLAMTNWSFSVKNDSLANILKGMTGKKVNLHYTETIGAFFWQGKTNKFVLAVEEVK